VSFRARSAERTRGAGGLAPSALDQAAPTLLVQLADRPAGLLELKGRDFEKVVAELLASFGWQVSLTQTSNNRGYDILGMTEPVPGRQLSWLVECKRCSHERGVGTATLSRLLQVASTLQISNVLVVTTGRFSSKAQALASNSRGLQLVDLDLLTKWVRQYRRSSARAYSRPYLPGQRFQSCFISYSSADARFVRRLVASLRSRDVPVWFAPDDLRPGDSIQAQVRQAINSFDRLLIVLSESSLGSSWVRAELYEAFRRERIERRRIVFPISLVPIERLRTWSLFDPDSALDIAHEIRGISIPIFSGWQSASAMGPSLNRLVDALERPSNDTEQELRDSLTNLPW
jgi:hypothetical protein